MGVVGDGVGIFFLREVGVGVGRLLLRAEIEVGDQADHAVKRLKLHVGYYQRSVFQLHSARNGFWV